MFEFNPVLFNTVGHFLAKKIVAEFEKQAGK